MRFPGLIALLLVAAVVAVGARGVRAEGRVVVLAADLVERAPHTLREFAETELRRPFGTECVFLEPGENGELTDLDALEGASLLVVFARSRGLGATERAALEGYVTSGKPVLVLGGARRAFEDWPEFEWVIGANPLGRWKEHGVPTVTVIGGAGDHPILAGLPSAPFESGAPLERVLPLVETATPLLEGHVAGVREAEPVAWTSGYLGGQIFVTTLGSFRDFEIPAFRRLLVNAVFWCLGEPVPELPAPELGEEDSVSLFDGETLGGWVTRGGRYDGDARWSVEDGVIVGRQGPGKAGGLLYTERPYRNFIVALETKIDYPFDSGVFLRMVPPGGGRGQQVTLDHRPGGEIGAIYADGYLEHNQAGAAIFRRDDWNEVVVRCVGGDARVTAWLNGELLVDYVTPPGTEGFAEEGLIGLQVHGGGETPDSQRALFRNVRIRELPGFDTEHFAVDDRGILTLTLEAARHSGWKPLFNGFDLEGWEGLPSADAYRVEEGLLVMPAAGGDGLIRTVSDYGDFELRLDFKLARMANSGLFLRSDRESGNATSSGCEVQILDDFNWERVTGTTLKPYQFTGGLYGSLGPEVTDALRPLGEWNTYEVTYAGTRLSVRLNGHLLYDVDTLEVPADPPFAQRAKRGFIGLQRHAPPQVGAGDFAWFRNLFIRELE